MGQGDPARVNLVVVGEHQPLQPDVGGALDEVGEEFACFVDGLSPGSDVVFAELLHDLQQAQLFLGERDAHAGTPLSAHS